MKEHGTEFYCPKCGKLNRNFSACDCGWRKFETYRMGDRFDIVPDEYMLVCTSDWRNDSLLHFQLVGVKSGNRYTSKVITHFIGAGGDSLSLEKDELEYLLDEEPDMGKVIASCRKGSN